MSAVADNETPVVATKPRRPRPDGLTYTAAELCYALAISDRQLRRLKHKLPAPLPIGRRPRWCREAIREWLANGARARR
jgi:predicted DNA-binding transcriptional regulator AlpA